MLKHLVLTIAFVVSSPSNVFAMKTLIEMVPNNLGTRFNLSKSESAGGNWVFTLIRHAPPALSRQASLSIIDESGAIVARMALAPVETSNGDLKYCFSISKSLAKNSCLELAELPKHSGPFQEVGGGNIFSFTLVDFIEDTSGVERFLRRHKIDFQSLFKASNANAVGDEPSLERKWPSE